ncbi:N-6 DNA methylase [Saccharomonospora xinjiangensis]|uniref:N-6 DNA methylase n=1 Tax=Saccharomonospora xinjiangensis TaxID=75294 RepID=UPI0035104042
MIEEAHWVSLKDIAGRAGVSASAVSNWRARNRDFPASHIVAGQETFDAREVARWLSKRRIPKNRLEPVEAPGTSYGDRFLRAAAPAATQEAPAWPRDEPQEPWEKKLWEAAAVLRGAYDHATSLELLLALVYIKAVKKDVWRSMLAARDSRGVSDVLSDVKLAENGDRLPLPILRAADHTSDSLLVRVVKLVDEIDLGESVGPESVAAKVCDSLLDHLGRAMGRRGGRFTPPEVTRLLAEVLRPQPSDTVYDPFCGSGELLTAAAARSNPRIFGQTLHKWSHGITAINLSLHGVEADLNFGNALQADKYEHRRFGRIVANPPFNLSDYLAPGDSRSWLFGEPPENNANFAWLQYAVAKLEPGGRAVMIMPVGTASSQNQRESTIRKRMVEAGVVECVIALPPQLFRFTKIPTMVWVLGDVEPARGPAEILFIDARDAGQVIERSRRQLTPDDVERIVTEYQTWRDRRGLGQYKGVDGFSRAVSPGEIKENKYVLTPARYVRSSAKQPNAARTAERLAVLRGELDKLNAQAVQVRAALSARLAHLESGQRPSGEGREALLGEVCDVLLGPGTVRRRGDESSGTPLVLPRNLRDNRITSDNLDVVPPDTAKELFRYRLRVGDVVSVRAGTLGKYGRVGEKQADWLLGPGCARFRPDPEVVDPDYLVHYLSSAQARRWIAENATGSAIKHVNSATLRRMPVWLPPLPVQREIAEALRPFEEAETVHGRISATAKELRELLVPGLIFPGDTR